MHRDGSGDGLTVLVVITAAGAVVRRLARR
ncbi:hypothetical protein SAMN05421810_110100 [Amycolatopsis arida]|uniref:Uncharacterized protein n=1 Tax=Amycolatopsis arida TaxID=587909 RepID=A0A1I5ZSJ8_9PSEU|nr:hypothetical protein CLV69_110101 [Amycolatopsis arida]SFQ59333.1 hypothetical protein SAMN05421810_110100 [Amycolatopsis arida]